MRTWRLVEPPGARSCRDGGDWTICRSVDGHTYFYAELERLRRQTHPLEYKFARQEILSRMRRAEAGTLVLSDDRSKGDVAQMHRQPKILEIRLLNRIMDGSRRHVRIYFTEPDAVRDQLLLLTLAWKHPGRIGLDEQDAHVDQSIKRADDHFSRSV